MRRQSARSRSGCRQGEIKRGAFIEFAFRPNLAAVPMDDALDEGQAHARAFEFFLVVQPLKNAEEFVRVLRIETDAVVLVIISVAAGVAGAADFDHGDFSVL